MIHERRRDKTAALVQLVPVLAVLFFISASFYQGDVGFQVDKTQHGLFVSRITVGVNPVKPGDLIVRIRGISYPEVLGSLFNPADLSPGLFVTVDRNDTLFDVLLHSIPMTIGRLLRIAGPRILLVSVFLLLANVAYFRAPESAQVKLFLFMLCGFSTSIAATLASCLSILLPAVMSLSFLVLMLSNWISFGLFMHFAMRFPPDRDLLKKKKWPLFLIYLLPPVVTIGASFLLAGKSVAFWGWLQRMRNLFLVPIVCAVFVKEWWDYRNAKNDFDRKRLKPLIVAYWISFAPYLLLYLLPNILFDRPAVSFRLVTIFFLVLPLVYFYVLVRHHLFDVDRLLSRFISYGLLTVIILVFYSIFLAGLKRWIFGNQTLQEELFLLFFVASVILFYPLQKRMEGLVERLFFRYRPVPAELLHRFSKKVSGLLSLEEIITTVVEELPAKINVDSVAVMLLGKKHSRLYPENLRFGSSPWTKSVLVALFGDPRVRYIMTDRVDAGDELARELKEIRQAGYSLVLAMGTAAGISGLLFIGFRKDGRRFSRDDIKLMEALANQSAIALENARRHASLVESKRQIEELFNERVKQEKMALVGEMTSMVAHEFKNPLGIIHSSAQYLMKKTRPPEVQREMLQYIMEEIEHLNVSIQSLLGLAKQPPPNFHQIDLSRELPGLVDRWKSSYEHNPRVAIRCRTERYLPIMYGDLRQLTQVLFNLIKNSEEMMPGGGEVVIEAKRGGDRMCISVRDTGPGIREEDRENLFKSFFTTKEDGIGLGLVVCHQIINAHNGSIRLKNHPDGGAVALIELPLRPLATTGLPVLSEENSG